MDKKDEAVMRVFRRHPYSVKYTLLQALHYYADDKAAEGEFAAQYNTEDAKADMRQVGLARAVYHALARGLVEFELNPGR